MGEVPPRARPTSQDVCAVPLSTTRTRDLGPAWSAETASVRLGGELGYREGKDFVVEWRLALEHDRAYALSRWKTSPVRRNFAPIPCPVSISPDGSMTVC